MNRVQIPQFLSLALLLAAATVSGCATGSGGIASAPAFPNSNLDHSSHLEQLQARGDRFPAVQQVGYQTSSPTFSHGSGSRSGSC